MSTVVASKSAVVSTATGSTPLEFRLTSLAGSAGLMSIATSLKATTAGGELRGVAGGSVAVAVTTSPGAARQGDLEAGVAGGVGGDRGRAEERCPSPKPDGSAAALAKKSSVNVVLAVLFSVPATSGGAAGQGRGEHREVLEAVRRRRRRRRGRWA